MDQAFGADEVSIVEALSAEQQFDLLALIIRLSRTRAGRTIRTLLIVSAVAWLAWRGVVHFWLDVERHPPIPYATEPE